MRPREPDAHGRYYELGPALGHIAKLRLVLRLHSVFRNPERTDSSLTGAIRIYIFTRAASRLEAVYSANPESDFRASNT